jgi:hypothetical protein
MEKTYFKLTRNNKDIVYKIMIGNNIEPVILVYCYSKISQTYSGFRFECYVSGVKALLKTYPNFLLDVQDTNELQDWFGNKGFIETQPTEMDLIIYDK